MTYIVFQRTDGMWGIKIFVTEKEAREYGETFGEVQ